jgi:hypothetical protein
MSEINLNKESSKFRAIYIVSQITINKTFMPHDLSKFLNSTPIMFRNRDYKQSIAYM